MLIVAHKVRLSPTPNQVTYFKKACGTARFAYNWMLAEWQRQYNTGSKPSMFGLKKQFNAIKRSDYPWVMDVTKCASESGFFNAGRAFTNFFQKRSKYPRFKKRGVHDSFTIANDQVCLDGCCIQIPKLGWVRMTESLRFKGKLLSATVSRIADRWFVALNIELQKPPYSLCENQARVGVDVGIKTLATLSTGDTIQNPNALRQYERRLARYQRQVSRKQKGSHNQDKAKIKVSRLHYRIACIRQDATHKLTTMLTQGFKTIVIEDLNVAGMVKNHRLAKAVSNANFAEIARQLDYKSILRQNTIVRANRFYPSSKTCSQCGHVNSALMLADRVFVCPSCGHTQDRDLNAAINLE